MLGKAWQRPVFHYNSGKSEEWCLGKCSPHFIQTCGGKEGGRGERSASERGWRVFHYNSGESGEWGKDERSLKNRAGAYSLYVTARF